MAPKDDVLKVLQGIPRSRIPDHVWDELPFEHSWRPAGHSQRISLTVIKEFIHDKIMSLSIMLKVDFKTLEEVIREENTVFFSHLARLSKKTNDIDKNSLDYKSLVRTLKLPALAYDAVKVNSCLALFKDMSAIEKLSFLQQIGQLNITLIAETRAPLLEEP